MIENYVTRITDSFKASTVERVLVIDDAYDPPTLAEEHHGELLAVLQRQDLRNYVADESLGDAALRSAIEALQEGDFEHEAVDAATTALFDAYRCRRRRRLTPTVSSHG